MKKTIFKIRKFKMLVLCHCDEIIKNKIIKIFNKMQSEKLKQNIEVIEEFKKLIEHSKDYL